MERCSESEWWKCEELTDPSYCSPLPATAPDAADRRWVYFTVLNTL